MNRQTAGFLKTRWGLEWIRLRRSPITIVVASRFVRCVRLNGDALGEPGAYAAASDGIASLSGLVAGSLSALQRRHAGLCRVHYLTQTNPTGLALLEEYLDARIHALGSEPVRLDEIRADGALLEVISASDSLPSPDDLPSADDASREEPPPFEQSYLTRIPPDADALAITDLHPLTLIALLENTCMAGCASLVYLSSAYPWADAWPEVRDAVRGLPNPTHLTLCAAARTAQCFVPAPEQGNGDAALLTLAAHISANTGTAALVHDRHGAAIALGDERESISLDGPLAPPTLARLLSGVLLSRAVDACLDAWEPPTDLRAGPGDGLCLGRAWAETVPGAGDFPTEADLLARIGLPDAPPGEGSTILDRLADVYHAAHAPDAADRLADFVQQPDDLLTSAAIDRLRHAGGPAGVCAPPGERIIFLDLDLTLFDYTTARVKGAWHALRELPLDVPLQDAITIYQRIIDHWAAFQLLGFPNLRRVWNTDTIYYLVCLLTSDAFRDQLDAFFALLPGIEAAADDESAAWEHIVGSEIGTTFPERFQLLQADVRLRQDVRRAYLEFELATDRIEPFDDARDLLTTLSGPGGCHVFVVTEGDPGVQWEKIEKLGLDDLVGPSNLIVTDGLARQPALLSALRQAERHARAQLSTGSDAERPHLEIEALRYLRGLLNRFRYKQDGHFFRHAVHVAVGSITGPPDEPGFANVPGPTWDTLPPVRLATVGDRYPNDIQPLIDLFGADGMLSIHMQYGKYRDKQPAPGAPGPDFVVTRLSAARNILLRESNWASKQPITRPTHFGSAPDDTGKLHALVGLAIPGPVHSICQALLEDAGYTGDQIAALEQHATAELDRIDADASLASRLAALVS